MGVEQHAFGTVLCGLLSRRQFLLYFCAIAGLGSCIQLLSFAYSYFADGGIAAAARLEAAACVGSQCYEVWSCHGLKDATEHLREPFLQGLSLVSAVLGFLGAYYGDRQPLKFGGLGLLLLGAFCIAVGTFDKVYTEACAAYPSNVVEAILLRRVPPSRLSGGLQEKLRAKVVFPVAEVDALTQNLDILGWHLAYLGIWAVANLYAGYQARLLGELVENGPLGLGVNFGMHQWDEFINHDELRRHCQSLRKSDFLDDANQPLPFAGAGYGTAQAAGAHAYKAQVPAVQLHRDMVMASKGRRPAAPVAMIVP